jgi:hypothetical protein
MSSVLLHGFSILQKQKCDWMHFWLERDCFGGGAGQPVIAATSVMLGIPGCS